MNELLCCPFCGNRELRYTTLKISREKVMAAVRCMQCLTCGPDGCGKEREEAETKAAEAWNSRVTRCRKKSRNFARCC